MDRQDETGALAAAAYFMALHDYAYGTGDLSGWTAVGGQDCEFCANVVADAQRVYGAGGRYVGGSGAYDNLEIVAFDDQLAVYTVQLHYTLGAGSELAQDGSTVRGVEAAEGYLLLDVAPSARGWVLLGGDAQDAAIQ